jgi:hypothetical protein
MRFSHLVTFGFLLCVSIDPALAVDMVLKHVTLSAAGVGYFEYEAEVSGDAELALDVPLDQVDDVLKSIVVYDDNGGVGSARLAGRDPLNQLFGELPFGQDALGSPAMLLNALQGAEIRVGTSRPITGRLLQVVAETLQLGDRGTTTRNRVSVMTATGLQQFILEEADAVSFVDAEVQANVNRALSEIAAHRTKDRRQIVLTTRGAGTRTLRVGYVVGVSLWKASFRLTLPPNASADAAHLQGWAVLENMTGHDWRNVELTLLSGNPVSFRQAIYEAYYVTRPDVPVEVAGRILPRPDTEVVAGADETKGELQRGHPTAAHRAESAQSALLGQPRDAFSASAAAPAPEAPKEALLSRASNPAEAEEGATQVAFRLPTPVSIAAGQSALVPIFDRDVPVERLSLFQPGTSVTRPLASLRVKNDTATDLPAGVLTLYERTQAGVAYVGDARISRLPAGESRLVSYAVDERTKVARDDQRTQTITKGVIAQGILTLTRTQRQTTFYRVAAPVSEARKLIIEHARPQGWKLVDPGNAELTASACRITVDLKPGETRTVSIAFETPINETLHISDMKEHQIIELTDTQSIDPAIKRAFSELARLRRILSDKKAAEEQIRTRIENIRADQERLRANLSQVDKDSALHKRYVEKLDAQETAWDDNNRAYAKAMEETRAATAAIDEFVAKLST